MIPQALWYFECDTVAVLARILHTAILNKQIQHQWNILYLLILNSTKILKSLPLTFNALNVVLNITKLGSEVLDITACVFNSMFHTC